VKNSEDKLCLLRGTISGICGEFRQLPALQDELNKAKL
jgi:hypothetical protein